FLCRAAAARTHRTPASNKKRCAFGHCPRRNAARAPDQLAIIQAGYAIALYPMRVACARFIAAAALVVSAPMNLAHAQSALPLGFGYLRDVDPSIAQDMGYASHDNFVGRPLSGYEAPECILRQEIAAALKRVQAQIAPDGLSLKVYDCYRPTRAVHAMAAWA